MVEQVLVAFLHIVDEYFHDQVVKEVEEELMIIATKMMAIIRMITRKMGSNNQKHNHHLVQ